MEDPWRSAPSFPRSFAACAAAGLAHRQLRQPRAPLVFAAGGRPRRDPVKSKGASREVSERSPYRVQTARRAKPGAR